MTALVIACAASVLFIAYVMATAPRSASRFCTDGDSDRVRRHDSVAPYRDGEVLPVIAKEAP